MANFSYDMKETEEIYGLEHKSVCAMLHWALRDTLVLGYRNGK